MTVFDQNREYFPIHSSLLPEVWIEDPVNPWTGNPLAQTTLAPDPESRLRTGNCLLPAIVSCHVVPTCKMAAIQEYIL